MKLSGYGGISIKGKNCYVHRYSYELHFEPPGDLHVCHKCDNPACVNPDHLFLGTDKDNRHDCINKDRHIRGSKQWSSILTDDQVKEIRRRYKPRCKINGGGALGREFGVTNGAIWNIVTNKSWKHLLIPNSTSG